VSELPIKATLKAGPGYEAPWLTVDASTPDELKQRLQALTEEHLQVVADVAALFRGAHTAAAGGATVPAPAAPAPAAQSATPTQTQQGGQLRTCAHGVRVERSGTGKKGPWVGYFCSLPKGTPGACEVVWG